MVALHIFAGCSLATWLVLIFTRGWFWVAQPQLDSADADDRRESQWPSVTALIPARNEAGVIEQTMPSVLNQNYPGQFRSILVDDRSEDGSGRRAWAVATALKRQAHLTVLSGDLLPQGWTGKVWAMHQGISLPEARTADFIWFTDADIEHDPGILRALVRQAVDHDLDLVSLMAQLRIDSCWDRLLIPAFVYFFAKLFPFRSVANVRCKTAGAAGGCMLVRRAALEAAGSLGYMRNALIDDCALGRMMKRSGYRIWLGFTRSIRSIRAYGSVRSVWDMVARSAFDQLNYSWLKLIATILGMLLLYAAPPLLTLLGALTRDAWTCASAATAWSLMALSFAPILSHQGSTMLMAPLLPLAGILYTAMTISSAYRHMTGRSKAWREKTADAQQPPSA